MSPTETQGIEESSKRNPYDQNQTKDYVIERLESKMSDSDYGSSYDDEDFSEDPQTGYRDLNSITDQDSNVNSGDEMKEKEKRMTGERKIKIIGELKPHRIKKKKKKKQKVMLPVQYSEKVVNFMKKHQEKINIQTQAEKTASIQKQETKRIKKEVKDNQKRIEEIMKAPIPHVE